MLYLLPLGLKVPKMLKVLLGVPPKFLVKVGFYSNYYQRLYKKKKIKEKEKKKKEKTKEKRKRMNKEFRFCRLLPEIFSIFLEMWLSFLYMKVVCSSLKESVKRKKKKWKKKKKRKIKIKKAKWKRINSDFVDFFLRFIQFFLKCGN